MGDMHEDLCVYTLCLVGNCNTWISCAPDVGFGLAALPVLRLVGSVMEGNWVSVSKLERYEGRPYRKPP